MPLVGLSADERLHLHQTQSDPIMMALKKSMSAQIEEKKWVHPEFLTRS
jgi:hypothetical protein